MKLRGVQRFKVQRFRGSRFKVQGSRFRVASCASQVTSYRLRVALHSRPFEKGLPGFQWVNIALITASACAPVSGVLSEAVFVVVFVVVVVIVIVLVVVVVFPKFPCRPDLSERSGDPAVLGRGRGVVSLLTRRSRVILSKNLPIARQSGRSLPAPDR